MDSLKLGDYFKVHQADGTVTVKAFKARKIHDASIVMTAGSNAYAKRLLESQSRAHLLEN